MSTGGTPNLHFPHLHRTQIYTNPKFTRDPNLHKPIFTRDPYLHSPDLHKSISVHRFQKTQIYTTQIYTKPEFTQPNFTHHPNLHKTYTKFTPTVLGGNQVVPCAATPLTLRVASGYTGGVFFELTRD